MIEIRGREIYRARAHLIIGLIGSPLAGRTGPWLDALMQFVQVDESGRPEPLMGEALAEGLPLATPWDSLRDRAIKLLAIRS